MQPASLLVRAAVAVGMALGTPAAEAQGRSVCADRGKIVERLAETFGETLQSLGLNQDNGVVEIYASEATGTWTILLTRPDGLACLLASGQMWEGDAAPLTPAGKDA